MSASYRSEIVRLQRELDHIHSFVRTQKRRLEENPLFEQQIRFWAESTRFLITELEIWDRMGETMKCRVTVLKVQKALDHLH